MAVLSGAAGVASAAPPGFVANAQLAKAESFVAGKPVAAFCAPTQAALVATVSSASGLPPANVGGSTFVGSGESYFAPHVCTFLRLWQARKLVTSKPANLLAVAQAVLTVAHEAEHAKGVAGETDADCAALHVLPQVVRLYFPLLGRESMHDFVADAWLAHSLSAPIYHAHAC